MDVPRDLAHQRRIFGDQRVVYFVGEVLVALPREHIGHHLPPPPVGESWENGLASEVDRLLSAGEGQVHEKLTNSVERVLILRALAHTGGRRIEAAQALGIGRNTITRKIHELGLDTGRADDAEQSTG